MSDNYRINFSIELYGKHRLSQSEAGEMLVSRLNKILEDDLLDLGFSPDEFFICGSGC